MLFLKNILKEPLGLIGLSLIVFWIGIALFAPVLAPPGDKSNPYLIKRKGFSSLPSSPTNEAKFGITSGGYDIYYGIIWGSRTVLLVGIITVLFSALIGVFIGGIGAYIGGVIDELVMRVVDLLMGFPFIIGVIVLTIVLGKGIDKVVIALILFGWRDYARIIRSKVLSVKEKEYIKAAKSLGVSDLRIFFKYIIPNTIFPILVLGFLNIGRITLIAASLSFIGVGAEPGYADWGQMLNYARNWLFGIPGKPFVYWFTYTYPIIAIFSFVLGWNLLGDRLRDIYDPQMDI